MTPETPAPRRVGRWPTLAVMAGALTAVLYGAVDRPAATWVHGAFNASGGTSAVRQLAIGLTHIVDPIPPLAIAGVLICGTLVGLAEEPPPLARLVLAMAVATLTAIAVKDELKFAFGRLWPETWINGNPSWIADGAFGFFPFHGGAGWSSFPSGHMSVVTAPLAVVMRTRPAFAPVACVPILLVAIGLLGADYHFLSDILAGMIVGGLCGVFVCASLSGLG